MESANACSYITVKEDRLSKRLGRRMVRFGEKPAEGQSETRKNDESIGGGENADKWRVFPVNAQEFVTAIGLGPLFALLQLELSNSILFAWEYCGEYLYQAFRALSGPVFFCATIIGCWYFSDRIESMRSVRVFIAGSFLLSVFVMLRCATRVMGITSLIVIVPLEAVCGIAYAIVLIMWIADVWAFERLVVARVMFLSLCIAAGLSALVSIIPTILLRYATIALCLVLSTFSYLAARPHLDDEQFVSRKETLDNIKFDMRTSIALAVIAMAYGLCLSLSTEFGDTSFALIAGSFLVSAIIVGVGMTAFGDRSVLLSTFFRWIFPVLTVGFIAMPFASGFVLGACAVVVFSACFTCLMSLLVTLVQVKLRFNVQPAYACARVLMPWAIGMVAGLIVALAAAWITDDYSGPGLIATSIVAVVLFSLSTAIAPYGIDALTMPIEPETEDEQVDDESNQMHAWKTACEEVAREGGLTSREIDVFMLLAKGRNAKVIERELFISVYTIKGHNNNIYRKLGVKSQQELIDLVENRRRDLWKPKASIEQGGEHE